LPPRPRRSSQFGVVFVVFIEPLCVSRTKQKLRCSTKTKRNCFQSLCFKGAVAWNWGFCQGVWKSASTEFSRQLTVVKLQSVGAAAPPLPARPRTCVARSPVMVACSCESLGVAMDQRIYGHKHASAYPLTNLDYAPTHSFAHACENTRATYVGRKASHVARVWIRRCW
jgi:hypothetical protein